MRTSRPPRSTPISRQSGYETCTSTPTPGPRFSPADRRGRDPERLISQNPVVPRREAIVVSLLVLTVAGCGYSRAPVPSLGAPAAPQGFQRLNFPAIGVTLDAPRNWTIFGARPPLMATLTSGGAVVALWRYVRTGTLPRGRARLNAAMRALIASVRRRQPTIKVIRSRIVHLGAIRGIELDALERLKGALRRVRSTHLYAGHEEIVLEEYAPVVVFHSVDRAVFSPMRRSLRITVTS